MHSTLLLCLFVAAIFTPACLMAQQWEIGAAGGFGWYADPTIKNTAGSAQAGLKPSFAFGLTFDQDMYDYIGGELRYTFRGGQPELRSHGTLVSGGGYTNVVTYDLLVYTSPKENRKSAPSWLGVPASRFTPRQTRRMRISRWPMLHC
jgi:hypothetical protein